MAGKLKEIEISILNKAIHCEGCELRIIKEIGKKRGIKSVIPNHKNQKIKLSFDEEKIKQEKIVKSLEKMGYFIEFIKDVN
ncbi:heavy-metal-associated domain-containing protein [Candidatus Harpocratesius sp.]